MTIIVQHIPEVQEITISDIQITEIHEITRTVQQITEIQEITRTILQITLIQAVHHLLTARLRLVIQQEQPYGIQ